VRTILGQWREHREMAVCALFMCGTVWITVRRENLEYDFAVY